MFKSKFITHIVCLLIATTSFLSLPVKTYAATTIFSDNFGSSYVTLASHVPSTTGTGYTLLINNGVLITVQSYNNHATVTANTANAGSFYTVEGTYPDADYEISSNVTFAGGDSSYTRSMGLRVQDANNMYLLRYGGSTMIMYKRVSGTWSTIGTASGVSLVDNLVAPYIGQSVSFSAVGTTLTAKVDGVTKLTVTDSSITATGKAGIGLGYVNVSTDDSGTGVGIDNVVVQTATSDSTAPTITNVSSDKTNGSYTVGEVIDIDVTFSEAVTSTGNVTVTLETGATDRTCTFTVTSATTGTCNYTVQAGDTTSDLTVSTISGAIADAATNAMSNFVPTTNLAANKAIIIDTTDPTVQSLTPVDNETNFSPTSVFLMTFNQAVDVETGNITIKKTSDDSTVETISVSGGLVTGTGTTVITIDPATSLGDLTEYYILVDATAFDDAAGNSYAGIVDTTSWSFTTGDINAPTISSISSSVERTTSTLTWTTNENSSSQVAYGLTSSYGSTTTEADTSTRVTSHSVSITGLTCNTTYHYKVISKDSSSNTSADNDTTFTTSSCPSNGMPLYIIQAMNKAKESSPVISTIPNNLNTDQVQAINLPVISSSTGASLPLNSFKFTKTIKPATTHEEVKKLQEFLNNNGFELAKGEPGAKGQETNLFGKLSKNALMKFQKTNKLEPDGIFGPLTRKIVNNMLALTQ
jgi:hypothetical protein